MEHDISFIPEEQILYKLHYLDNSTIEYPYRDIGTSDKKQLQQYTIHLDNSFKFVSELGIFARSKVKEENYKLTKKCCEYLLMIRNDKYGIKKLLEFCNEKTKMYKT